MHPPPRFPLQDTIAGMEEAARKLPKDDAQDLRMRVCGILRSSRLPKPGQHLGTSAGGSKGNEGLGGRGNPTGGVNQKSGVNKKSD